MATVRTRVISQAERDLVFEYCDHRTTNDNEPRIPDSQEQKGYVHDRCCVGQCATVRHESEMAVRVNVNVKAVNARPDSGLRTPQQAQEPPEVGARSFSACRLPERFLYARALG